ncbi:MAG: tetratricopeptide repeat protein [Candidatus Brocadiaceae bacterium]|nr:tetratricopeptide repeat protein [Candidatus Brocadiaceae bacterium]
MASEAQGTAAPNPYELYHLGDEHLTHWEIEEAEEVSRTLMGLYGDSPEALYLAAKVKFYLGDYNGAIKLLEGRPKDYPEGREFLVFLTRIYGTARDFVEYPTPHFLLRYAPGKDEVLLDYAQEALEKACMEIGKDLDFSPKDKVVVEIYPTLESFSAASTLTRKEIETSGAVAICHFNRLMVLSPRLLLRGYPWMDTLAHEYVHYVISHKTRNLTPIWFHEGLAKFEESRWKSAGGRDLTPVQRHLLAQALERDSFITFEEMHPSIAKLKSREDAALAFAEVLSSIRYIVKRGGYPLLNEILQGIKGGKGVEEAVADGLAVGSGPATSFDDFQMEWRSYLQDLGLSKIPGLQVMATKIKEPGKKEDSPMEIEAEETRRFAMLGDTLSEENRPDAALLEYEKAHQHSGLGSPQVLNKLANSYLFNGRLEEAERLLNETINSYPDYVSTYVTLGELHKKRGEPQRAIENYLEASHINPFNPVVHQRLATLYKEIGQEEEAIASLKRLSILLKGERTTTP